MNFSTNVQIDFFFILELTNQPILHMVNLHTVFSATYLMSARELSETTTVFELQ